MIKKKSGLMILMAALALTLSMSTGCAKKKAQELGISAPEYKVRVERDVMVPVSDGTRMATDIYFPAGLAQAPVILVRTPYGKKGKGLIGGGSSTERLLAQRGYIVVVQDVRGRYGSEGNFYPFIRDGEDGQDVIAWIEGREWFNGKLGTYGGSYLGATQWFMSPGMEIDAMHLIVTSPDMKEVMYTNGELHLMTIFFWSSIMGEHKAAKGAAVKLAANLDKYISTLPLSEADDKVGRDVDYFNDSLDLSVMSELYQEMGFEDKYDDVQAPAVFVVGWYDMFEGPQLNDFNKLLEQGGGNADKSILIVGPWGHGPNGDGTVDYGEKIKIKDITGPAHLLAWFDYWLKGDKSGVEDWPRVQIFVMGDNVWRDEDEWPLARTRYTNYYIHSGGDANTRGGDGTLTTEPPSADEPRDKFDYDPLDPVPSLGGNNLGLNLGAYDQSKVEDREDVLCYTSAALETDVEVTGPITGIIYAASDAKDTDFTMKLVDVYPDGTPVNIQDGIVRAMFRDNDPDNPTPLTPGAIEKYELDLWATSNVFKKGHRIRVEISSSHFPRFNRNLNTGEPPANATRAVVAHQTIHHDPEYPTHIVLPIIPRDKVAAAR